MAAGVTTISGAYTFDSTSLALAEAFIEAKVTSLTSGAYVFTIPSGGNTFYIGVVEGLVGP